jgi:hypothetical protein
MENIILVVDWGGTPRTIELSKVTGSNTIWWNVMVGRTVYGEYKYRLGKWETKFSSWSDFETEDQQIMLQLVQHAEGFEE